MRKSDVGNESDGAESPLFILTRLRRALGNVDGKKR